MQVTVDNLWATPSTLHMRVTVWPDSRIWRQKFYVDVPIADIPEEVLQQLADTMVDDRENEAQLELDI